MNKRTRGENPIFMTVPEAAQALGLGMSTTRKLAAESRNLLKIGRTVRVNITGLREHLERMYTA